MYDECPIKQGNPGQHCRLPSKRNQTKWSKNYSGTEARDLTGKSQCILLTVYWHVSWFRAHRWYIYTATTTHDLFSCALLQSHIEVIQIESNIRLIWTILISNKERRVVQLILAQRVPKTTLTPRTGTLSGRKEIWIKTIFCFITSILSSILERMLVLAL